MPEESSPPRRDFLSILMGVGFLSTFIGAITPVVAYLMPLKNVGLFGNTFEGTDGSPISPDSIHEGSGKVGRLAGRPTLVIRKNGQFLAFSAVCSHLGCIVRWDDSSRQIQCPCHGARFDLQGMVTAGPAPDSLPPVSLRIDGNKILKG